MNIQDFITEHNGELVGSPHGITGQCVALSSAWAVENGWPELFPGNTAYEIYVAGKVGYQKIDNTPSGIPLPGDIIFWNTNWGNGDGHTAVIVDANVNTFHCFEQNDGDNGLAHVGQHNYTDVVGWFHYIGTPGQIDASRADNDGVVNGQGLRGHTEPNTSSPFPWTFDNNEHITLLAKTQGENITAGPYAPSSWWYLAHGNDANAQAAGYPQVWVSDAFVSTTHTPANVPDYQTPTPVPNPPAPQYPIVADISSFEGSVDFSKLKGVVSGVIVRAGHYGESLGGGAHNTDTMLVQNRDGARAAGIPLAFYWYGYPTLDPTKEAGDFVLSVGDLRDGESLWLDIEEQYDGDLNGWCDKFATTVEALTGRVCNSYTYKAYLAQYKLPALTSASRKLWEANYNNQPGVDVQAGAVMHQYTNSGTVDGISGKVDLSAVLVGKLTDYDVRLAPKPPLPAPTPAPNPTPPTPPQPNPTPAPPQTNWIQFVIDFIKAVFKAITGRK